MKRLFYSPIAARFLIGFASTSFAAATPPKPVTTSIDEQIQHLADPDPAVRNATIEKLLEIGTPARSALRKAANDDDPQLSNAAREALAQLPWFEPGDSLPVAQLLKGYGAAGIAERIGIVGQLGNIDGSQPALLRLLTAELNTDVCWQIVAELSRVHPDAAAIKQARDFDPNAVNSAAVYFAGQCWLNPQPGARPPADRARAHQLLRRAIDMEAASPSYDNGQLDGAFDELVGTSLEHDQPTEAIRLRRLQCRRIGKNRDAFPSPFFSMLAIYVQYGPMPGITQDLAENDRFIGRPESLALLSRIYRRIGSQAMAASCEQLSIAAAVTGQSQNLNSMLLDALGINDLAAEQARATLARADAVPDAFDVEARYRLARLATKREDDAGALQQFQIVLADRDVNQFSGEQVQEIRVEIAEHQLRLAKSDHDSAAIDRAETDLVSLDASGTDAVIELVPLLNEQHRTAEANTIFDATFQPMKKRLDAGDADPALLNEMAWLSAKCDLHLPEALEWARQAVAGRPASAAYLDTLAEANFRNGHPAESVRLETKALHYEPGDLFMHSQLKRFERAAATQPASATGLR